MILKIHFKLYNQYLDIIKNIRYVIVKYKTSLNLIDLCESNIKERKNSEFQAFRKSDFEEY